MRSPARSVIARGNKPLDPSSPVPATFHCFLPAHKTRIFANASTGLDSSLVGVCGSRQGVRTSLQIEERLEWLTVFDAQFLVFVDVELRKTPGGLGAGSR